MSDSVARLVECLKKDSAWLRGEGARNGHSDIYIARAPGRLDVMGGIADYSGGLVCAMPLEFSAAVAVQRRDDRQLVIRQYPGAKASGAKEMKLSLDDFYGTAALLPLKTLQGMFGGEKQWAAHVAGAFPMLAKHMKMTRRTHGANIACYSSVPEGGGLGGAAALGCATLFALTAAYHLILEPMEMALLAQKLEQQIVGSARGVMGQMTSVLGKKGELLLMECQPHEVKTYLAVPAGLAFVGIQSGVQHSGDGSAYRRARVATFMAQAIVARFFADVGVRKDLTRGFLANLPEPQFERYFRHILPERMNGEEFLKTYGQISDRVTAVDPREIYEPRAAAEHHVREKSRVRGFLECLRAHAGGDKAAAVKAGNLMVESHASYSRNVHLGSAETDLLVELAMARGHSQGIFGARISGGGTGGAVTVLAQAGDATSAVLVQIMAEYQQKSGQMPQLAAHSSPGAADMPPQRLTLAELSGN